MSEIIYLDNAATTQVSEAVLNEMLPFFRQTYSNPSAIYGFAEESKKAITKARTQAAELIGSNRRKFISQAVEVNRITGH